MLRFSLSPLLGGSGVRLIHCWGGTQVLVFQESFVFSGAYPTLCHSLCPVPPMDTLRACFKPTSLGLNTAPSSALTGLSPRAPHLLTCDINCHLDLCPCAVDTPLGRDHREGAVGHTCWCLGPFPALCSKGP